MFCFLCDSLKSMLNSHIRETFFGQISVQVKMAQLNLSSNRRFKTAQNFNDLLSPHKLNKQEYSCTKILILVMEKMNVDKFMNIVPGVQKKCSVTF